MEKSRELRVDNALLIALSAALPDWVVVYVPSLGNRHPYVLQRGNVLAFEKPARSNGDLTGGAATPGEKPELPREVSPVGQ